MSALQRPVAGVLIGISVFAIASRRHTWQLLCRALALGGGVVALVGLADVLDVPTVRSQLSVLQDSVVPIADVRRLSSALSHPNIAASVLALTLPLLVAALLSARGRWQLALAVLVTIHVAALSLTFSRAAAAAAFVALAVVAVVALRRGSRRLAVPVGVVAAAAPLGLAFAALLAPQVERRLVAELEQADYRASYAAPSTVAAAPDQVLEVAVTVTNHGTSQWSAVDASRVALGYHLLRLDGTPLEFDSPATLLPADVPPRGSLEIVTQVRAPSTVGVYVLEWDALREGVAWFSWRGSPTTPTHLLVEPSAPGTPVPVDARKVVLPHPSRIQYWQAALDMLRDYPLLGVGPDNYRVRFTEYSGSDESHDGTHAHSFYLESLANTGVLGFAGLCLLLGAVLRLGVHRLIVSEDWLWRSALLASLTAWLVHGVLDDFERFLPTHFLYWIVLALLVRGAVLVEQTHRDK
jgi:O-antigen ligase